jgi:hypothetical protein
MSKVLVVHKLGWGWEIDAHAIAHHRATYYSSPDRISGQQSQADSIYEEDYNYTVSDNSELIDWYENNMNWEDIPDENKRLVTKPPEPTKPSDLDDLSDGDWSYWIK